MTDRATTSTVYTLLLTILAVGMIALFVGCRADPDGVERSSGEVFLSRAERAYHEGRFRRALALLDSAERTDPAGADQFFLRGLVLTRMGLLDRADSAYEQVAERSPNYEGLWYNRGNIAFRRSRFSEAIRLYGREDPSDTRARVWTNVARSYSALGRTDSARIAYHRAFRSVGTRPAAYAWMSKLFHEEGRIDSALFYAREALRREPANDEYRYLVGHQLVLAGRPDEAIPDLEAVLKVRRSHPGAHYNLGRALTLTGRETEGGRHLSIADSLAELESELEQLLAYARDHPESPGAWIELANAQRSLHRYREALLSYQRASSLVPGHMAVRNDIANVRLILGDTTRAIQDYRRILETDPRQAEIWFNLGVVFANQGDTEQALRCWRQTLKYVPDHELARKYVRIVRQ